MLTSTQIMLTLWENSSTIRHDHSLWAPAQYSASYIIESTRNPSFACFLRPSQLLKLQKILNHGSNGSPPLLHNNGDGLILWCSGLGSTHFQRLIRQLWSADSPNKRRQAEHRGLQHGGLGARWLSATQEDCNADGCVNLLEKVLSVCEEWLLPAINILHEYLVMAGSLQAL